MASSIVARNYAETLFALAQRHGGESTVNEYGDAITEVASVLHGEPLIREFLETPRVGADEKKAALEASFKGRVPDLFLRFLLVVVEKRRQGLLEEIATQYHMIVDEARGRARAEVRVARAPSDDLQKEIVASLERRFGKKIVADFEVDESLIGGIVIRVGDEILDGSLGRRVTGLRRRLLEARLPAATPASSGSNENQG